MQFNGYQVGTVVSTILVTPPNYSFKIDRMYVGNSATAAGNDVLYMNALQYNSAGSVTGTVPIGIFPQVQGTQAYVPDNYAERVPTGSYLVVSSQNGNITLTLGGHYEFYRE